MDFLQVSSVWLCSVIRARNPANETHAQRLARFLDRPLFPWKKLIIGFSVAQYLFEGFLGMRQYRVLQNKKPPKVLELEVSQEVHDKSQVSEPWIGCAPQCVLRGEGSPKTNDGVLVSR